MIFVNGGLFGVYGFIGLFMVILLGKGFFF